MSEIQSVAPSSQELVVERFVRKPFYVDAIQVTEQNQAALAEWCGGVIEQVPIVHGATYIKVPVARPLSERQTRAFVGDWILRTTNDAPSFKVYINRAFAANFDVVESTAAEVS